MPVAGQTAGPIGLKLFVDTHGWPGGVVGSKNEIFFPFFFTGNAGPSNKYLMNKNNIFSCDLNLPSMCIVGF